MKKVFISVPFKGRTDENILDSIDKMHKVAEQMFGEKLEPVHNFFILGDDNEIVPPDNVTNESIYFLSEAVKKISICNYFIGVPDIGLWNGCDIESKIALNYIPGAVYLISLELMKEIMPDIVTLTDSHLICYEKDKIIMNSDKFVETIKSDLEHINLELKEYINTLSYDDLQILYNNLKGYKSYINYSDVLDLKGLSKIRSIYYKYNIKDKYMKLMYDTLIDHTSTEIYNRKCNHGYNVNIVVRDKNLSTPLFAYNFEMKTEYFGIKELQLAIKTSCHSDDPLFSNMFAVADIFVAENNFRASFDCYIDINGDTILINECNKLLEKS